MVLLTCGETQGHEIQEVLAERESGKVGTRRLSLLVDRLPIPRAACLLRPKPVAPVVTPGTDQVGMGLELGEDRQGSTSLRCPDKVECKASRSWRSLSYPQPMADPLRFLARMEASR